MPVFAGPLSPGLGASMNPDVVEIGLLLPTSWAEALVEMSKSRGESVAQIVRGLINREIVADRALDREHDGRRALPGTFA